MADREREVTMRFLAEPTDINFGGKVHGGAVMKWIDQAGYTCAAGWSGQYCVTVYVGGISFYKPVLIGNVVEAHARLVHTGRTRSMHVVVDVGASDPKDRLRTTTTHCVIVFVAVDERGDPVEVTRWLPETRGGRGRRTVRREAHGAAQGQRSRWQTSAAPRPSNSNPPTLKVTTARPTCGLSITTSLQEGTEALLAACTADHRRGT